MLNDKRQHSVHRLFVYLLIGLFAVMAILTVLFSAQVYKNIVDVSEKHNDARLARAFIVNTIHAGDRNGGVRVEKGAESDTLILCGREDGEDYYMVLYCERGKLMQVYTSNLEKALQGGRGEAVCAAESLSLLLEDGLLDVAVTLPGGEVIRAAVAVKTE